MIYIPMLSFVKCYKLIHLFQLDVLAVLDFLAHSFADVVYPLITIKWLLKQVMSVKQGVEEMAISDVLFLNSAMYNVVITASVLFSWCRYCCACFCIVLHLSYYFLIYILRTEIIPYLNMFLSGLQM
jgi:hypothetical protein